VRQQSLVSAPRSGKWESQRSQEAHGACSASLLRWALLCPGEMPLASPQEAVCPPGWHEGCAKL